MALSQREKLFRDIRQSFIDAERFNASSPVVTRQMTEEEKKELEWQTTEHESCHKLKVVK